jgi:hypothetical protein
MKLTNRLELPQPIVDAVRADEYSRGDSDMSVTQLLKPPRITALEAAHADEIEEDVSDRIFSLLGQCMHTVLERADKTGVCERRLSVEIEGIKVSGQMDRYEDGTLSDYKLVTAYKFKAPGVPEEYAAQVNCYAHLLRANGHPVKRLEIVGILRDWSKLEAQRDPEYPQRQVVVREVPMWSEAATEKYLRERVILHRQARVKLPLCSDAERWAKDPTWAVMKEGGKRAVRVYSVEKEAQAHAASATGLHVVFRPGVSVRCGNYCSVAKHCEQHQSTLRNTEDESA